MPTAPTLTPPSIGANAEVRNMEFDYIGADQRDSWANVARVVDEQRDARWCEGVTRGDDGYSDKRMRERIENKAGGSRVSIRGASAGG